ncbi:Protein-S-isoprenylcysteine O-methyltransferase Ste14 [Fodinibius salinus]|uniref:Protein-S-isoprenylcysteine O-methyltransferase Ste14 n=1 Tax=Fodinibius salinus TaxID=860790 RepID=A0A5D3YIS1_9BACT|nr:isoprenylcysteine carboxylmethyltransferase family protein [Fodinibius salinus]TYP92140.1 Protein-S-isoprenylcysteine O-methyltransferase Ste14 [Fodinibius salinus]
MALKIPPALVFVIIAGLMHLVSLFLPFGSLTLSGAYWVAGLLMVAGGVLGVAGLLQFYRNGTSVDPHKPAEASTLVTDGIYQYTRNPMYLALFFLLIAYASILQNVLNLFILPLFIWYMNKYQIIPEEEIMEEKFSSKYLKYKSEVHRWL